MVVFAVVTGALAVDRHHDYRTYRNDLGNMVQVVDNTAHGRFLEMTGRDGRQISRLAAHVDPILVLFALPWLAWPDPAILVAIQAAVLALTAWPAYMLGRRALGDPMAAVACAAAVLLYPPLQFAALDEFHPVSLAIPLLLFAFAFLDEDRRWSAVPFLVAAALCKEQIPLVIALMGVYFALRHRRLWPLLITAAATAYFAIAVGVVIPFFNDAPSAFLERYSTVETGLKGLAWELAAHPWRLATTLLGPAGLAYLGKLLWPFGFTSLASPLTLLISLPELLINLLSSKPQQQSIAYHYVAGEVPFVIAAMILGLRRLAALVERRARRRPPTARGAAPGRTPPATPSGETAAAGARSPAGAPLPAAPARLRRLLGVLVVAVALVATLTVGPLSGARPGWGAERSQTHRAIIAEALALVPDDASVSADNGLGAHLSARERILTFPRLGDAEYVVLDSEGRYGRWRSSALERLRDDDRYERVFERNGVLVFKRVD